MSDQNDQNDQNTLLDDVETLKAHPGLCVGSAAAGCFPSLCAYFNTHGEYALRGWLHLMTPVVASCLLFSVVTVWTWANVNFGHWLKATTFVISVEGAMIFTPVSWIAQLALCILIGINAIATASIWLRKRNPTAPVFDPVVHAVKLRQRAVRARAAT